MPFLATNMQFQTIPAAEALRPYIRNYWMVTATALPPMAHFRVMTNGAPSMCYFLSRDGSLDDRNHLTLVLIGASMHNFTYHFPAGPISLIGVEFHPAGLHAFFDQPASDMVDQHLSPSDMHDEGLMQLDAFLATAQTEANYKAAFDQFFLSRLEQSKYAHGLNMQRIQKVFSYIEHHHPMDITIADLASEACLSLRQFTRVFTEYVGLTPKNYLRIYRFHAALMALREHEQGASLMQLAWENGYYDLSHMTSDFRDICKQTPTSTIQLGGRLTETFCSTFSLLMKKKILPDNAE